MKTSTLMMLPAALVLALPAFAQQLPTKEGVADTMKKQYSPYVGRSFPTTVYWGDTHLHTAVSVDAGTMCTVEQEDAFRFARGEEITTTHGLRAKLGRPLDFLVVTDHAEMYGLMPQLKKGDRVILSQEKGRKWYDMLQGDDDQKFKAAMEIVASLSEKNPPIKADKVVESAWRKYTALADKYNEPGRFTALIGYEYTTFGGYNLHRNVVFRGDASVANQTVPFSQYDSQNPEDLWRHLDEFQNRTGAQVLAIPHNGNLSNGRMFSVNKFDGKTPYDRELAEQRARLEPIVEVTQIKGDGETHPLLSPNDEFADFDTWDKSNLNGTEAKTDDMLKGEYAREALKTGLALEKTLGVNPFKFGMIGSTDSHTAMAAVEEENFFGKHSGVEPGPHRWEHIVIEAPNPAFTIYGWQQASGGYAGVWATENTREAIFDAMMRKETYATTGSRMIVRFFGGWNFDAADTQTRLPAATGYEKGVPMGGDLRKRPEGKSPSFLVAAMKDPYSGNLDRIQIVKGWLNADGSTSEKVYDVVWSGDRRPGEDGKVPAVGNTVDVANATWTNTIGAPELIAAWTDPDFDPQLSAFYYARVLEIPTPRWTAYEAKRFNITMSDDVPMVTQERAYTSPIWYTPTL
jgi:hypothetical protein